MQEWPRKSGNTDNTAHGSCIFWGGFKVTFTHPPLPDHLNFPALDPSVSLPDQHPSEAGAAKPASCQSHCRGWAAKACNTVSWHEFKELHIDDGYHDHGKSRRLMFLIFFNVVWVVFTGADWTDGTWVMLGQFQDRWITVVLENCRYCRQQESLRLLRKQTRTFPRLSFASTGANMCRPSTYTNLHAGHCMCPQIKFHVADVPNFEAVCGSDFIDLHDLVYALNLVPRWNLRQHQHGDKWQRTFEGPGAWTHFNKDLTKKIAYDIYIYT